MIEYNSIAKLAALAAEKGVRISDVVLADQAAAMEKPAEELLAAMKANLGVMRAAAERGVEEGVRSSSGLSGGAGRLMARYTAPLSGAFCAKAITRALAIAEYNAAMGKIVAAPTAGSCGILPAAILTMMEERRNEVTEDDAVMAMFTAGAFGMAAAAEASIAGAEGGCQAECGTAAAITAAAITEMAGGSPEAAADAFAIALKNQLGLVCDPVAGLVEVPCVKRNAGGVMCAIAAADMALAGIKSVIPADEVITAMRDIGDAMDSSLKETARGGLAATPTAQALRRKIFG